MQYLEEAFGAFNPSRMPAVQMSRAMHTRSVDRSIRHTEDALEFVRRRLAADRQLWMDLLAAGDMPDHARVWAAYWHLTLRDYVAQTGALGAVLSDMAETSFQDAAASCRMVQDRPQRA